jgi:2-methylisocitrate lyase-like PEP mutase family enzyme
LIRGRNDLADTIRPSQAFEAAGADVLYAPGLTMLDEVRLVTGALTKPVNVLAPLLKGVTVAQLADAGAKRISTGGRLRVPPSPRYCVRVRRCVKREASRGLRT